MTLENILKGKVAPEEAGTITDLKETGMPVSGLERVASVICAMASKLLELLLPLYGSDSEEGKRLMRAIRTLSPLTKGIKAEDIAAVLKVIETIISGTPGLTPEQISTLRNLALRSPFVTEVGAIPGTIPAAPAPATTPASETGEAAGLEEVLVR